MDRENVVHLHNEYYLKVKQTNKINDVLKFACKWMELEKKNILSEAIQTLKDEHGMYSLMLSANSWKLNNLVLNEQMDQAN